MKETASSHPHKGGRNGFARTRRGPHNNGGAGEGASKGVVATAFYGPKGPQRPRPPYPEGRGERGHRAHGQNKRLR